MDISLNMYLIDFSDYYYYDYYPLTALVLNYSKVRALNV